jgi:uncharacterized protein YhjY with autotransporter beta-barrel domain
MATPKRPFFLLGLVFSGCLFSALAHAECGSQQQCIAVSTDPTVAPFHSLDGVNIPAPTLNFGNQATATTSATQTILVAAVEGPADTKATLDAITLSGANATEFRITGGTCTVGTPTLLHDGARVAQISNACTITVTFNPATVGAKTAQINVQSTAITRVAPLAGTGILAPPVITSALAATGAVGAPFSGYQITATNSPTSFTASPLPQGLSMSASGAISGTPTLNGTVNTTITATNAAGTDTRTLVFTISATAPVITSGQTASGTTGQTFNYQITASNLPLSFNAIGLPAGLSVNTATGLISGTPAAGGSYKISVTATNATGTASQAVTITIGLVVPAVQNQMIDVLLNTPKTVDLGTSSLATGIRIAAAPAHGTAVVSGTKVTYTPANNYFGPDAFTYLAIGNDGESPTAVVTVNVIGRPDPSQDPVVRGLIRSQAETAKRFSRAQIFNFQRRMESLHLGAAADVAAGAAGFGSAPRPDSNSAPIIGRSVAGPGVGAGSAGAASDLLPTSFLTTFFSAASTRSVNLSSSSDRADGSSGLPDGTGVWIGGSVNFGARDQTSDSSSLQFSTDGTSVGVDRRFSDKLTLGLGLGYARDRTDIGTDGTKSKSSGSSIAVYGSYQPTKNTFVDGLIGYGVLNYDTDRYVASVADFAQAHRKGDQLFGSVAAGYEYRRDGLLFSPYGRLDFANDRLKQTTETGAGLNALTYFGQNLPTLQLSLGLRAESQHDTNFGRVLPRLRLELKHDFEGDRQAEIAYADQFAGPRYAVTAAGVNRNSLLIGVGSDFILRNGLKLGVDYQVRRAVGPDHSQAIRLWVAKDLDGKSLSSVPMSSALFENPVRVEAGYTWDDNLTRARDTADKLSDQIYSLNLSQGTNFRVSDHTRVVVNGFVNGEKLHTYTRLDRFSGGVQGEFQYRTSAEFDAPTFGIFGRMSFDDYDSQLRTGYRSSVGLTVRQSLTDRIDAFAALASNARNARSDVFDARDRSARFNLDYSLGRAGSLYVGGEYRRGDTATSGPATPAYTGLANVSVQDDAYGSRSLLAYRYQARTELWTLGYNLPLGPRDSLDLSWRHARSTPTGAAAAATYSGGGAGGTSSYTANQYSLAYLMRF